MKLNKLLFCSALLAAPFSGLIANDSAPAAAKESSAASELRLEAIADLQNAFDLSQAIENIDETATSDFVAANPMAETSIFKQMPSPMMARIKEADKPGISETKTAETLETASTDKTEGFTAQNSVVISNT